MIHLVYARQPSMQGRSTISRSPVEGLGPFFSTSCPIGNLSVLIWRSTSCKHALKLVMHDKQIECCLRVDTVYFGRFSFHSVSNVQRAALRHIIKLQVATSLQQSIVVREVQHQIDHCELWAINESLCLHEECGNSDPMFLPPCEDDLTRHGYFLSKAL